MQAGCLQALWELGHWDIGILEYWSFRALKSRCSVEHWRVVLLDLDGLDSWRHKEWFISPSSHERGVTSDRQACSWLADMEPLNTCWGQHARLLLWSAGVGARAHV